MNTTPAQISKSRAGRLCSGLVGCARSAPQIANGRTIVHGSSTVTVWANGSVSARQLMPPDRRYQPSMSVLTTPSVNACRPAPRPRSHQAAIERSRSRIPGTDTTRRHPDRPCVASAYTTAIAIGSSPAGPFTQKATATSA